uniref:Protein kinase domain-containing protein n=1 Tax=Oryzias latipes TaxID=8090 RepID=A0A3P9LKS4_ORYLA
MSGCDIFERLSTAEFELNEREIVNYIRQICSALEFLHGQSYGHFDIRPENIVYTTRTSSNVKIIELGQSRHLTPGDQIKIQYTTAEYAAPEIHQCDMVSTVTDMWSVGVLAYVLLSGLNPFTAETNQQMIDNISGARLTRRSVEKVEVVTQTPFSLDHAPRITIRMRSHRVPYGSNTRFSLNIQAKPEPEVKWFHNGKEIHQSSKHQVTNISGVLTLQINSCVTEDSGTYRVVCKNNKGEISDYATLDVTGEEFATFSSLQRDEEPPSGFLQKLSETEIYHEQSSKVSLKETESVKEITTTIAEDHRETRSVPATIVTKPQSLIVNEGDTARFECDVDGEPSPSITWLREGVTVGPSFRHHIVSSQYNSIFEISAVEMSDEGNYTLLVENPGGKQESDAFQIRSM